MPNCEITAKARGVLHPQEVLAAIYRHTQSASLVSTVAAASGIEMRIVTEPTTTTTLVSLADETNASDAGLVEAWLCNYGCRSCGS
jgi:hypothetical protein